MNLIEHFGLLNRLEELLESQREEEKNQKLQKWEDWKAHIKYSFGNCEDKLADLKSKGDPKDKKDIEEQIALNKVRSWSFIIIIVSVLLCVFFLSRMTDMIVLKVIINSSRYTIRF